MALITSLQLPPDVGMRITSPFGLSLIISLTTFVVLPLSYCFFCPFAFFFLFVLVTVEPVLAFGFFSGRLLPSLLFAIPFLFLMILYVAIYMSESQKIVTSSFLTVFYLKFLFPQPMCSVKIVCCTFLNSSCLNSLRNLNSLCAKARQQVHLSIVSFPSQLSIWLLMWITCPLLLPTFGYVSDWPRYTSISFCYFWINPQCYKGIFQWCLQKFTFHSLSVSICLQGTVSFRVSHAYVKLPPLIFL